MKLKNLLAVLAGCGAIFAALLVVDALEPQPVVLSEQPSVKMPVSVLSVTPHRHQSSLTLLATTSARWPVQLKASSSAQLAWLNPELEPGVLVKQGTGLAKLNSSALESDLALAHSSVKQAELNLQQARHEQTVALKILSAGQGSAFARREPQVAAAKAALQQALRAYSSAAKLLEEATIVAPFDAVILQRNVSPGEWLAAGQVAFELAASASLDVVMPVSELHWQQLQPVLSEPKIQVRGRDGTQWPARLRYVAPQADAATRQRQIVLAVQQPYQGKVHLLPNQQVKVIVSLGEQPQVVALPLSAVTRDGYVWSLDEQNRLQKESLVIIEQQAGQVYARFTHDPHKSRQVVVYPLLSMLPGKQVMPQPAEALLAGHAGQNALQSKVLSEQQDGADQ